MIISLSKLKSALEVAINIMLEDYIKGTKWDKRELLMILHAVESGELDDQKSFLTVSHVNIFLQSHFLYQDFYIIYYEAMHESDVNAKVFVNTKTAVIISKIMEKSRKNLTTY